MKTSPQIKRRLTLLMLFIFLACDKEQDETDVSVTKDEEIEELTDPFYAVLNEKSSLKDYWDLFVKDAIRSGKQDSGEGRVVNIFSM
mgnify:FL=1